MTGLFGFVIALIAVVVSSIGEDDVLRLNNELRRRLSEEQKNAECCQKKLRCCKQRLDPPDIEIRAILVRCPRNPPAMYEGGEGFDEDEPLSNSDVTKCNKKLLITMRIKNAGPTNCKNVFVVVDHVYDPGTSSTARLLNPYVIKIKQEPITALYKLHFQHVVNAEAKEVVYNKHNGNYTGCDTTSSKPTCGVVKFNGKIVPFSRGFCCSCDALVNSKRQPDSGLSPTVVASNTEPLSVQCPKNLRAAATTIKQEADEFKEKVDELQKLLKEELELDGEVARKAFQKRQVSSSGNQRRGGQNCADRYTPRKLNPRTYHESTHCLKFSDLWYTVYQLQEPFLEHSFHMQLFEKHEDNDGNTRWRDLTKGKMIRMGMFNSFHKDDDETIAFHYKSKVIKPDEDQSINFKSARLLVPEGTAKLNPVEYPEINGGPGEYLVVQQNQVSMDGDQCNIAGVGYEAFYKQPNRCSVPRGSICICLIHFKQLHPPITRDYQLQLNFLILKLER